MQNIELINELRELAEWAEENIWEVPVYLPDRLRLAADLLEAESVEADWRSAKYDRPKDYEPVQVTYIGYNDHEPHSDMMGYWDGSDWCLYDDSPPNGCVIKVPVTHWRKIPGPPKEKA